MGYSEKTNGGRLRLAGMLALILGLVLFGGIGMSGPAYAEAITCGGCHSIPPSDSDNSCPKPTAKNHPAHATVQAECVRCHEAVPDTHPSATHNNAFVEITSAVAPGLSYAGGNCANACHANKSTAWGGSLDCNSCHFRSGATGVYQPSGLHVTTDRTWKHYSSPIKVFTDQSITCTHCHPDNESDTATPRGHITSAVFEQRGNMTNAHNDVSLNPGLGYTKGATPELGTCTGSCHYNGNDPFGNYTIFFKPGQKRYFGPYQSRNWGDTDLNCNECHSTPSQEATFGSVTSTIVFGSATSLASINANKRHEAHMFKYKLNPFNFMNDDRNIYCDDCHRTPDIFAERGFRHHSTTGEGGSGVISLPVKSQNARVYLGWRNNNVGRDGEGPATFERGTCNNVYCHTIMVSGMWTEPGCNSCHGDKDGVDVGSGAPGFPNLTSPDFSTYEEYLGGGGAHYSHVMKRGYPCRTCHYNGGGDGNPANHNEGAGTVLRAQVDVGVHPDYWFNNQSSAYDWTTRSCNNVKCHYGSSQNWDCEPLH